MGRDIVYLTGATGFVGKMIVKCCDENESISKVYVPIRDKKGLTGQQRFDEIFGSESSKAAFLKMSDPIPADVTLVLLNAFEVKFFTPVQDILKENVEPMLRLLDQCREAGPRIRGISVVSTAYVQPPLPFARPEKNRIPFQLGQFMSASDLYEDLVGGTSTWDKILKKYGAALTDHHKGNCYAFSKHIMEHVIHERYFDLPVCVVRPAIVAPTRDGSYGKGVRTGLPLFIEIAQHSVVLFPRNEGKLHVVFVEDAAADIIQGAAELAEPATRTKDGALFHPIICSTSPPDCGPIELFHVGAPHVRRYDIRSDLLRAFFRTIEILILLLALGKKKAKLLGLMYENYDPIMSNNFDFEERHPGYGKYAPIFCEKFYGQEWLSRASKLSGWSRDGNSWRKLTN